VERRANPQRIRKGGFAGGEKGGGWCPDVWAVRGDYCKVKRGRFGLLGKREGRERRRQAALHAVGRENTTMTFLVLRKIVLSLGRAGEKGEGKAASTAPARRLKIQGEERKKTGDLPPREVRAIDETEDEKGEGRAKGERDPLTSYSGA